MHENVQKLSNLRPLKCILKYSFKSGLISGVGSRDIFRKNCVQKLHVKYCLAVLQRVSLLTLHPVSQPTCLALSLAVFPFQSLSSSRKCMDSVLQLSASSGLCAAWQSLLRLQLLYPAFSITALRQGCLQSFWFTMEPSWGGYALCVPSSLLFILNASLSSPTL